MVRWPKRLFSRIFCLSVQFHRFCDANQKAGNKAWVTNKKNRFCLSTVGYMSSNDNFMKDGHKERLGCKLRVTVSYGKPVTCTKTGWHMQDYNSHKNDGGSSTVVALISCTLIDCLTLLFCHMWFVWVNRSFWNWIEIDDGSTGWEHTMEGRKDDGWVG